MTKEYPTRNLARGVLMNLERLAAQNSISINDLTSYCIYQYKKKYGIDFVTFVFTNALVDMFSYANVANENIIEPQIIADRTPGLSRKIEISSIDDFFKSLTGLNFENWFDEVNENNLEFKVNLSSNTRTSFNIQWFNNSDKFIPPLLKAYQDLKREKGMLFQNDDIIQIPIDYSVILCYNHYKQFQFLNEFVIDRIVQVLTNAANDCIVSKNLSEDRIKYDVMKDLTHPTSVSAAYTFISRF